MRVCKPGSVSCPAAYLDGLGSRAGLGSGYSWSTSEFNMDSDSKSAERGGRGEEGGVRRKDAGRRKGGKKGVSEEIEKKRNQTKTKILYL